MEQTLTLNSVSLAVKFFLPVCTFLLSLMMPSSSVTLSLSITFPSLGSLWLLLKPVSGIQWLACVVCQRNVLTRAR